MLKSLLTAEEAMQREQIKLDVLANNLANVNTTGFKQTLTSVQQLATRSVVGRVPDSTPSSSVAEPRPNRAATQWSTERPVQMRMIVDPRPGQLRQTGRETDLAIVGRGLFVVKTAGGDLYTRNGQFRLDGDGRLVTAQGLAVQGARGDIVVDGRSLTIDRDGSIVVDGERIDELRVVQLADLTKLEHRGDSLLSPPQDVELQEMPREQIELLQGHLESSNVSAIESLIDMIAAQRAFEVKAKLLSTADEMLAKSVNQLPANR